MIICLRSSLIQGDASLPNPRLAWKPSCEECKNRAWLLVWFVWVLINVSLNAAISVALWLHKLFSPPAPRPSHFISSGFGEMWKPRVLASAGTEWKVSGGRERPRQTWLSTICSFSCQLSEKWIKRLQKWRNADKVWWQMETAVLYILEKGKYENGLMTWKQLQWEK